MNTDSYVVLCKLIKSFKQSRYIHAKLMNEEKLNECINEGIIISHEIIEVETTINNKEFNELIYRLISDRFNENFIYIEENSDITKLHIITFDDNYSPFKNLSISTTNEELIQLNSSFSNGSKQEVFLYDDNEGEGHLVNYEMKASKDDEGNRLFLIKLYKSFDEKNSDYYTLMDPVLNRWLELSTKSTENKESIIPTFSLVLQRTEKVKSNFDKFSKDDQIKMLRAEMDILYKKLREPLGFEERNAIETELESLCDEVVELVEFGS